MLAYAHINLLSMLSRFEPEEVVRVATGSIYIGKSALKKLEGVEAYKPHLMLPKGYCHRVTMTRCRGTVLSYLNGGGGSGKTTRSIKLFRTRNPLVFTPTHRLAKEMRGAEAHRRSNPRSAKTPRVEGVKAQDLTQFLPLEWPDRLDAQKDG